MIDWDKIREALTKTAAAPALPASFLSRLARHAKDGYAHQGVHGFVGLTGGIALADMGTRALVAKKGERWNAAKKGLKEGAVYGALLSAAEPGIGAFSKAIKNV